MKFVVILVIASVAGFMAYMAWKGECSEGTIVYSQAQCVQSGSVSAAACQTVFRNAADATRRASTVYQLQEQCNRHYEQCVRSAVADGFTPVPVGFCVGASGSTVTRQEPIYRRQNLGVNWNLS